jgi:hypothetical protein
MLRRLDGRRAFVFPTWRAWLVVALASWFPAPVDWLMARLGPGASRKRGISPRSAP